MVSPLKNAMAYPKNGMAPKGVQSGATPKIMKGARAAGEKYKTPSIGALRGRNATDKSSGQSNPTKGSTRDKEKYNQAKQPVQFSNAERPAGACKFVC